MDQHLRIRKTLGHFRMIRDVIEMPVRQPQPDNFEPALRRLIEQRADGVIGRIEDDRLL